MLETSDKVSTERSSRPSLSQSRDDCSEKGGEVATTTLSLIKKNMMWTTGGTTCGTSRPQAASKHLPSGNPGVDMVPKMARSITSCATAAAHDCGDSYPGDQTMVASADEARRRFFVVLLGRCLQEEFADTDAVRG